jgi:hypothetical protein
MGMPGEDRGPPSTMGTLFGKLISRHSIPTNPPPESPTLPDTGMARYTGPTHGLMKLIWKNLSSHDIQDVITRSWRCPSGARADHQPLADPHSSGSARISWPRSRRATLLLAADRSHAILLGAGFSGGT